MSRPGIAATIVVVAAVAAVWLLAPDRPGAPDPSAITETAREPTPPEPDAAPEPAATGDRPAPRRTVLAEPAPAAPEESEEEDLIELAGTFVVVDQGGVERAGESGSFQLVLWHGNMGSLAEVAVENGAWRATIARPEKISVDEPVLGGKAVVCSFEPQPLPPGPLPPDYSIALRGSWVATLALRVVDDATGTDLSGVRVVVVDDWRRDSFRHPGNRGDHRPVVEDAASPVAVQPQRAGQARTYWVGATGYAWDKIKLSLTDTSERVIRLAPGGGIVVAMHGGELPRDAVLRLRPRVQPDRPEGVPDEVWEKIVRQSSPGMPIAEISLRSRTRIRVEGLPVGPYQVRVEKGGWFDHPVKLGEGEATIIAGQTAQVAVALSGPAETPVPVPVAGTLVLPEEWKRDGVEISIEARGDLRSWVKDGKNIELDEMTAIQPNVYAWDAGALPPGDYQVLVAPCELRTRFHVGAGGARDVRIEVPAPAQVRVRVVDASTGSAIPSVEPGWYAVTREWEGGWGHAAMKLAADGSHEFQAAPGEIEISAHPDGYGWVRAHRRVEPGFNEFLVQVERACGVAVVLLDGDTELPWDEAWLIDLVDDDGKSVVDYWSGAEAAAKRPGRYRVSVRGIKGYEPIEPQRVTVQPGEWTRHEIRLQRK